MAVLASGDRTRELAKITAPTLVIHGREDRLIPVRAGRNTAAAIPARELELIDGMGHDLPPALWERVVELIVRNIGRAQPAPSRRRQRLTALSRRAQPPRRRPRRPRAGVSGVNGFSTKPASSSRTPSREIVSPV